MLKNIYKRATRYFSRHVVLNSLAHMASGFGLALILQDFLRGDVFINPMVGWVLVALSLSIHVRSCMK